MVDGQLQTSTKTQTIAYICNDEEKPGRLKTLQHSIVKGSSVSTSESE